jgi:single-stranded DNA-binding protein
MIGYNIIILMGVLIDIPEEKLGRTGKSYVRFWLDVTTTTPGSETTKPRNDRIPIICFGGAASFISTIEPGSLIHVTGMIECYTRKRPDGSRKEVVNVVGYRIQAVETMRQEAR